MIAVLAVVVNHISAKALPGGFVGVDVFFVISGFLITGRLLRTAHTKSTGSYFGSFYKLRVRRLLPAAAVTLLATVILSHLVFYGERAKTVTTDAVWALFFGANWHFSNVGTNYFNHDQATSPVQHYWSLSVEEQFYVVWPIVILLAGAWWVKRQPDRLFFAVRVAALVVVAGSLAWGWHQTSVAPTHAYFSTFSRAWELAVGAFLATLPPSHITSMRLVSLLSWAGLAIIGVAVAVTPDGNGFPVPWAIPAVLGSAVIIHAGRARQPANFVLCGRLSTWLGDISYSIYLVHFPAWILLAALIPDRSAYLYVTVAATTLAAAVASYYFVEEPGRRGLGVLVPRNELERHAFGVRSVVCALAALVALGCVAIQPPPPQPAFAAAISETSSAPTKPADPYFVDPLPDVQEAIQKGLTLTSWPKLTNADSSVMLAHCSNFASLDKACHWEPAPGKDVGKTVLLMGDSVMHSWLPMISGAFTSQGWKVVSIAEDDCFSAYTHYADDLQGGGKVAENTNCDAQHAFFQTALKAIKPDLVVLDNMSDAIYKVSDGKGHVLPHDQQVAAYKAGVKKTIGLIEQVGAKALMLSATPDHKQIEDCRVGSAGPQSCISSPSRQWLEIRQLDVQISKETGAKYADIQNFFCYQNLCPSTVGNLKAVIDNHHITQEYAKYLEPSFEHYLSVSGLLGPARAA
jgi:peptidoglycan/LPS O-acetylase OafA/YrhL